MRYDSCLNHLCYIVKLTKLPEGRLKAVIKKNPEHAEGRILVVSNEVKKIFGKTDWNLNGLEYQVKLNSWKNNANKTDKGVVPCFGLTLDDDLEIVPSHWKEEKKEPARKEKSDYTDAVKILDLPKEEAAATIKALDGKKESHWEFETKIREKIFWRLMEMKASQDEDEKDIDRYLVKRFITGEYGHGLNKDQEKIFKIFTGKDPAKDLKDIKVLPWPRLFALLTAIDSDDSQIPCTDAFMKSKDTNGFLVWTGVPREKIKELYQEAIREALPKPKAEKTKPAKAKAKK
jgi:hypothetical protein